LIETLLDMFLHLDKHLAEMVARYGNAVYGLLAAILFLETGVVVTPFLPGDSLLFACGALAATGALDVRILLVLLPLAVMLGDNTNYYIGRTVGPRAFTSKTRWLKREHLDRTHAFYERHGGKTIIMARFVPIVRTFAPFVAGIGRMAYARFLAYSVAGGLFWVFACLGAGYAFGNIPIVRDNFSVVVLTIVAVSLLPIVVEYAKHKLREKRGQQPK
jgi:membrane-associated protein